MYGREKIDVVNPTNAVSATRKTLNGSTKNCLSRTSKGPSDITRTVSAVAARNVSRHTATLTAGACSRSPTMASSTAPAMGRPRTAMISIMGDVELRSSTRASHHRYGCSRSLVLLELFHMLQVQAVELLTDLEEEHAEDKHADQHVERNAQLDHHRHTVGGAGGGKE